MTRSARNLEGTPTIATFLDIRRHSSAHNSVAPGLRPLIDSLRGASAEAWLDRARPLMLRSEIDAAIQVLEYALENHPSSVDIASTLAGALYRQGQAEDADTLLSAVLKQQPGHMAAAFMQARERGAQGRTLAAAQVLREAFAGTGYDPELLIQAIEVLEGLGRQADALQLCESHLAAQPGDPRFHLLSGALALQTGDFALSRRRYAHALAEMPSSVEWHAPLGLASTQRYSDPQHEDFDRFARLLERDGLSERARSSLLFALAKAHDDVGEHAAAAGYWRQGNALARTSAGWSRKRWSRSIQARMAAPAPRLSLEPAADWTPVFIVGMPRSGTTLVAERLAAHPMVRHRGELGWLATLSQRASLAGPLNRTALEEMARTYAAHLLQDDAPVRWYIDKQPLNLRYVDLILAMWPHARIIHCVRNERDTALSLWAQSFGDEQHGYAYDFRDMAVVMRDCSRLMGRWKRQYPDAIRSVRYEEMVADTSGQLEALGAWLGLPDVDENGARATSPSSIATASLWQVRQPVHAHSVERWRHYQDLIPELVSFGATGSAAPTGQEPSTL